MGHTDAQESSAAAIVYKEDTLPPGLSFLFRVLPTVLGPPLALHAVFLLLPPSLSPSAIFRPFLYFLALPLYGFAKYTFKSASHARDARRLGAVRIPQVRGNAPGNIDIVAKLEEQMRLDYCGTPMETFIAEYGKTYAIKMLWDVETVFTMEPEHIKAVLATDFTNFIKGNTFIRAMKSMLGQGVFNSDGDMWKFHRSITRPFFTRDRITDFDTFNRHADAVIERMKESFITGTAVDYQDMAARFTLDSAAEFLFGISVDSTASPMLLPATDGANAVTANPVKDFAHAFADTQMHVAYRSRIGPLWPIFELTGDKTAENMKVLHAFADPIVERALREKRAGAAESTKEKEDTLLSHLVEQTDDADLIRSELLNILIAGRDTTASTLTFATYALAMYPHVLRKLRQEILDTVGTQRRPTFEDVRQMKYLRAVLNETLRLFPPVPFDVRQAVKSTTLSTPNGPKYYVPADTQVVYSVLLMHRDPSLWGPDSLEFDPERWIDSRLKKYVTPNPFIFLPFNAGPRICLGQQFAYNETSFFLIRLLQQFDEITLAPEAQPLSSRIPPNWAHGAGRRPVERVWPKAHLTLYAEGGLWLKMKPASEEVV
ncbi:hypothetical protein BOTBODRAFT_149912 [Botryobasidium botryosum FD-172 SS1]|uniref:Cytochrome P450 monooxygenase pc-3 n=1 Tax=Botryobasidium botryosum (strain FD-172 SS1) TaxID=930990 RepID=A0A067MZV7_BOTB1|nr:hypothetical protein BOTBODRAFT_149912 [Botryobasidium botryosum FD-172 SS1]